MPINLRHRFSRPALLEACQRAQCFLRVGMINLWAYILGY